MTMQQLDEHLVPRRYRVVHRTTYDYSQDVTGCYERGVLAPRDTPSQRVVHSSWTVSPPATAEFSHVDYFGNESHYLEVSTPHQHLEVVKDALVDVAWPAISMDHLNQWTVEQAADALRARTDLAVERSLHTMASAKVEVTAPVVEYARTHVRPHQGLGDALEALTLGIFKDFAYRPGVTTTRTTLTELLELRQGVCQDFAHLAIGCLRLFDLPVRYVSGYLETSPPPGQPKLAGSDATHAWASVLAPDGTWVDIDPTNAHFADSRYVVSAWGRDFADVSPLKGVIFTEADKSSLSVGVDVIREDVSPG
ncbi:transglutaminase family protein [Propionibacteriaceae bacterium Y1923]|uniref:transglutaminase family protein n=1 Tax=Aestuariimicrobium sp. Y1814 TaxID=3418742 RepID=UPI003C226632